MKLGLSIRVTGMLFLSIISLLFFILFVKGLPSNAHDAYCFFARILDLEECKEAEYANIIKLSPKSYEELVNYIIAYSLLCVEDIAPYASSEKNEAILCYTLLLDKSFGPIYEKNVTRLMEAQGVCKKIQNGWVNIGGIPMRYDGSCGERDDLLWEVDGFAITENTTTVLILYNTSSHQIIIKA